MNKKGLNKNIGKRCKIIESPIAGLTNATGIIEQLILNTKDGFRYKILIDPQFDLLRLGTYYIPVLQCEVVETS